MKKIESVDMKDCTVTIMCGSKRHAKKLYKGIKKVMKQDNIDNDGDSG